MSRSSHSNSRSKSNLRSSHTPPEREYPVQRENLHGGMAFQPTDNYTDINDLRNFKSHDTNEKYFDTSYADTLNQSQVEQRSADEPRRGSF